MDFLTMTIGKQKNIALIAHDSKKHEIIDWCEEHKEILKHHFLCGTGTTAKLVSDRTGLPVRGYNSGPLGGDQQIGARIAYNEIDMVIFFNDPGSDELEGDLRYITRLCDQYSVPFATNIATAEILIHGLARGDLDWREMVRGNKPLAT